MAESVENVLVVIYSITGAFVASFYNNTNSADDLTVECSENKVGGLDEFSFTVPADTIEPLFGDMECRIHVNGEWWYSGYAETIPYSDTTEDIIEITGLGYQYKLKNTTVNESYTAQTLEYIIKDLASNYLGSDINVYYDELLIEVPAVTDIDINFDDDTFYSAIETLFLICNKDYLTQQYTWGVNKEKYLYFSEISNDNLEHLFEGYNYQEPEVEAVTDKIINKILTYRATDADASDVEYIATYSDLDSQANNGIYEDSITYPYYVDSDTMENIANSIFERYAEPLDRQTIESVEVSAKKEIGFYGLSNRRDRYFFPINDMEDVSLWDLSLMTNTTVTEDTTNVFTGRKSLKLVTAAGSAGEYMDYTLDTPIKLVELFRLFVYFNDANGDISVNLIDSRNNEFEIDASSAIGTEEWLKQFTRVSSELVTDELYVDYDATTEGELIVDYTATESYTLCADKLVGGGIVDIAKVRVIMNTDSVSTLWLDSLAVRANSFYYRSLTIEEISYTLNKSHLADIVFGESEDNLIDEISDSVDDGSVALSVFSKQ